MCLSWSQEGMSYLLRHQSEQTLRGAVMLSMEGRSGCLSWSQVGKVEYKVRENGKKLKRRNKK